MFYGLAAIAKEKHMKARLGLLALLLFAAHPVAVMAQDAVKLFKVITSKDEVLIGLTSDELRALGTGPELDALAKRLATDGQMTVWQYAVRKDASGALQQAPLKRIAVFKSDTLRIEPYTTPLAVIAPGK